MSFTNDLEKRIIGIIIKIENAKYKEDGIFVIIEYGKNITKLLKALKNYDEVSAEKLSKRYVESAKANAKKQSNTLEN